MGIGAQSPPWRRLLFRLFRRAYFRRTVAFEGASFEALLSPGSSLKFADPRGVRVEPVHARFIRDWVDENAVVWDIGANAGLFALPAALRARRGRVLAFEPDVELAAILLRTLRLPGNRALEIPVLPIALSDTDGSAAFEISKYSRAMNKLESVGRLHQDQVVAEERRIVPTMRIDTLAQSLHPPTALKIDVEGAEMHVLEGGEATIARHRPAILIECTTELARPMGAFFGRHGYVMLDGAREGRAPLAEPVWDTFAIPRERA